MLEVHTVARHARVQAFVCVQCVCLSVCVHVVFCVVWVLCVVWVVCVFVLFCFFLSILFFLFLALSFLLLSLSSLSSFLPLLSSLFCLLFLFLLSLLFSPTNTVQSTDQQNWRPTSRHVNVIWRTAGAQQSVLSPPPISSLLLSPSSPKKEGTFHYRNISGEGII